jgi:hypothetical protein
MACWALEQGQPFQQAQQAQQALQVLSASKMALQLQQVPQL